MDFHFLLRKQRDSAEPQVIFGHKTTRLQQSRLICVSHLPMFSLVHCMSPFANEFRLRNRGKTYNAWPHCFENTAWCKKPWCHRDCFWKPENKIGNQKGLFLCLRYKLADRLSWGELSSLWRVIHATVQAKRDVLETCRKENKWLVIVTWSNNLPQKETDELLVQKHANSQTRMERTGEVIFVMCSSSFESEDAYVSESKSKCCSWDLAGWVRFEKTNKIIVSFDQPETHLFQIWSTGWHFPFSEKSATQHTVSFLWENIPAKALRGEKWFWKWSNHETLLWHLGSGI